MIVQLIGYPHNDDYLWAKECALETAGLRVVNPPDDNWLHRIADAEHSPMHELVFKFRLDDVPYWVSQELCRHHIGIEKYCRSQRNDRQNNYDRNEARQDAPVSLRITLNTQALINLAHKRLCGAATRQMQYLVSQMCRQAENACGWLTGLLVPMCEYRGGVCHEIKCCGRCPSAYDA